MHTHTYARTPHDLGFAPAGDCKDSVNDKTFCTQASSSATALQVGTQRVTAGEACCKFGGGSLDRCIYRTNSILKVSAASSSVIHVSIPAQFDSAKHSSALLIIASVRLEQESFLWNQFCGRLPAEMCHVQWMPALVTKPPI